MSEHDGHSPAEPVETDELHLEPVHIDTVHDLPAPVPASAHIARLTEIDLELAPAPSATHAFPSVRTPAHRAS
jgi:hypothetical protein